MPTVVVSRNVGIQQVAATAPPEWPRVALGEHIPREQTAVVLCEEKTFGAIGYIRGPKVAVVFDSIRKPPGYFEKLGYPVFTLDAPARGAEWLYTPVRFIRPAHFPPRDIRALFIGKTSYRQSQVQMLEAAGVTIISTDIWRPYVDYVDALKRAQIVVNLCRDRVTERPQLKGRVLEAMFAGAMLAEEANALTREKLPSNTYWAWAGERDLKTILHEVPFTVWKTTALRGQQFVEAHMTALQFWNRINERCNLLSQSDASPT